jgi:hypothetical protein
MITPPVNAPDPRPTQARKTPKRRERAPLGGGHGIPPVDPAAPDGTQPPPNLGKLPGKQHRRFSGRARILAGSAGMLTVLVVVIVVIAVINSGSAPPSPTSLLPATATIFQDNFSSQAHGWRLDSAVQGGSAHYSNGTYRIYAAQTTPQAFSSPKKASSVYPSAPSNIRVEVDARFVPGSVQANHGYYVTCRASPNSWYAFTIWDTFVSIDKFFSYKPYYKQLNHTSASAVHLNAYNLLQAQCTSERQGVQLVFSVNGQVVIAATDTDKPLQTGSVGLGVENVHATKPVEAEFDNFVVKQV